MKKNYIGIQTNKLYSATQAQHSGILVDNYQSFEDGDWIVTNEKNQIKIFKNDDFNKNFSLINKNQKILNINTADLWKNQKLYEEVAKKREV